jgi:hypothetical protein
MEGVFMTRTTIQTFLAGLLPATILLLLTLCLNSLPALAQQPPGGPQQPQQVIPTGHSRSLGEQIAGLHVRARELMPRLQIEAMRIIGWAERISLWLGSLLILYSFLQRWRDNNGQGSNLWWWFGRLTLCLLLVGSGPAIIDELYLTGKEIAEGNESVPGQAGQSMLFEFYYWSRASFNESYDKMVDGQFKVKVNGQEFAVKPADGMDEFLGVIYDQEGTIRDFNSSLVNSAYIMPKLFTLMSGARGLMEVCDIWLVVLAGILLIAFKMAAPIMIWLGVDQKISQRTVHPYLWGLIVLTLVWPSVSYFIRGIAYMAGNIAMAIGDTDQVFIWSDEMMKQLRNPLAQPVYTVAIASVIMFLAACCLPVSPFLAYSFSMGRVFESVSQTATQFAGSMAGTIAEWWSANIGAKIARQAENTQIQGSYESESARARGELDYANSSARARQLLQIGETKANQVTSLSQVYANRDGQVLLAKVQERFGNESTQAQAALARFNSWAGADRELGELNISTSQHTGINLANYNAELWYSQAGLAGRATSFGGPVTAVPGAVAGWGMHLYAGQVRLDGQQEALLRATGKRAENINETADKYARNQDAYVAQMKDVYQQSVAGQINAANFSASQAAGGISRGAQIRTDAINQSTTMELDANQARFDAHMDAARMTRNAGLEASGLRAMEHVFSRVLSKVARDIEKNVEMRF